MDLSNLAQRIGVDADPQLLQQALTHRSYAYEHGGIPNNERLEFLGDSVLGFVVTDHIFHLLPNLSEGELTKVKNAVVSEKALAIAATEIGLGEFLLLGRGEEQTGGRQKPSLLADAFEAVLGAVYLSVGLPAAADIIDAFVFPLLADTDALRSNADPKTTIVELAQARGLGQVSYVVTFDGPDHDRTFFATLQLAGNAVASADGRTKKAAETAAAEAALAVLR